MLQLHQDAQLRLYLRIALDFPTAWKVYVLNSSNLPLGLFDSKPTE